jgi:rSAM/selenodomain-associated transferase 1
MHAHRRSPIETKAPRHRAAPFRCRLVVIAKTPVAGAVKTRLAREVGVTRATRFARAAGAALLARVGADPRWQTIVAVAPDAAVASHCWPSRLSRMPQGGGDLGARMQRIFDRLPPGPALIVGTDVPGVAPAHIARAFRLLGAHDAVLGPAADGGYWLVGLRRRPRRLSIFADVRWSGPHALADTLANLEGRAVAFAATLGDVDDAEALAAHAASFGRRVLTVGAPPTPGPSPQGGGGSPVTCSA